MNCHPLFLAYRHPRAYPPPLDPPSPDASTSKPTTARIGWTPALEIHRLWGGSRCGPVFTTATVAFSLFNPRAIVDSIDMNKNYLSCLRKCSYDVFRVGYRVTNTVLQERVLYDKQV